jgi:hypothetical protein
VLYIRPTDLFHFSPSAKAEFLACRAFPFSRMDESAWHYLRRTILSFAARAFTAWTVRFNFAAIRRIDVLASIKRFEAFLLFPGPSIAAVTCHRKSPFSYFGSLKELSCERMCRTVSIMARIASGRVSGALCLAIQASRALRWEGCRRTPIKVPLPVGGGPLRFFVITV